MFSYSPDDSNKSVEAPPAHPGALPGGESAKKPLLPEPPYEPYAEKPLPAKPLYEPYSEKRPLHGPPYEPYKDI
jgi:hypothetical protein